MSAPSPSNVTQTPQREFALQRYYKKMIYANNWGFFAKNVQIESGRNGRRGGAKAPCRGRNQAEWHSA